MRSLITQYFCVIVAMCLLFASDKLIPVKVYVYHVVWHKIP